MSPSQTQLESTRQGGLGPNTSSPKHDNSGIIYSPVSNLQYMWLFVPRNIQFIF